MKKHYTEYTEEKRLEKQLLEENFEKYGRK